MKLGEIAEKLGLTLEGNADCEITGVAGLDEAGPTELSFLSNPRYAPKLKTTHAGAVIVGAKVQVEATRPLLRAPDAYLAFAHVLALFYQPPDPPPGIHPTAVIDPTARLGDQVSLGPYVVIGANAVIGDRVTIQAHCTIYPGVTIGADSYLHANCVVREFVTIGARCRLQNQVTVGSDGFGYAKQPSGAWFKIVQAGTVVLEDDVEIGAGSQIDRASIGETRICRGAKIDNLVQVGHGSTVGEDTLLCAQVGLAGSSQVGNRVTLAGQVGVAGHLTIGDDVVATAQTGIPNSVEPKKIVSGYPAIDNRDWLKASVVFQKLPELYKTIRALQERVAALEQEKT
ncbi:MAG: UDP-3-O-(3-hydroxymyristoyl)glucosamine N-acyltransferase [Blastocatellia bacterium]|nr:UDP-3-O-(3-hydroxymyristoyl)glucosamine N-acyltransferase [Blastocatellia bacterium]